MTGAPKLSPEEILAELDRLDEDDALAQSVRTMSPEARQKELAAAGVDLKRLASQAAAMKADFEALATDATSPSDNSSSTVDSAPGDLPPAAVINLRRRADMFKGSALQWFPAAAAAAGILYAFGAHEVSVARLHDDDTVSTDAATPRGATHDQRIAASLRDEAFAKCATEYFEVCLEKLDQAAALDPAGEAKDPRIAPFRAKVAEAKARAEEMFREQQKKAPPSQK
jgi:hypothetical protein